MSTDRSELVGVALDEWRLRDVERDWQAVVASASAEAPARTRRMLWRGHSWRWRILVAAAVVLVMAAPAIAAVSGALSWPWSHRPGAQLVATVPGTTLRLNSHGALLVRTSRGVRFLSPAPARQKRRFAWQLTTDARIASAQIVLGRAAAVELCSPCSDERSGTFNLAGSRALDVLNGHARLRVRNDDRTLTSPIQLKRLR
jgi:hypothetical protein